MNIWETVSSANMRLRHEFFFLAEHGANFSLSAQKIILGRREIFTAGVYDWQGDSILRTLIEV